jgi:hypothetical protein
MEEFAQIFVQFQDHLSPKLDMYEQSVYLYLLRHSRLEGKQECVVGFKSARKKLGFGISKAGTPPSEHVIYEKLRGLEQKGCIKILGSERAGTRFSVLLPAEIPGLVQSLATEDAIEIEAADFYGVPENRRLILERERWACFYCLAKLDENNHVLEHVVSRPVGDSSYRNVVAACRRCNNRKGSLTAEDYMRVLYRSGVLSGDELPARLGQLSALQAGELKPQR